MGVLQKLGKFRFTRLYLKINDMAVLDWIFFKNKVQQLSTLFERGAHFLVIGHQLLVIGGEFVLSEYLTKAIIQKKYSILVMHPDTADRPHHAVRAQHPYG